MCVTKIVTIHPPRRPRTPGDGNATKGKTAAGRPPAKKKHEHFLIGHCFEKVCYFHYIIHIIPQNSIRGNLVKKQLNYLYTVLLYGILLLVIKYYLLPTLNTFFTYGEIYI
jgi:hypothetical protein